MKNSIFKEWLMSLEKLSKRQVEVARDKIESLHWDNIEGGWQDTDSPTTEFRAMTSFS